MKKLWVLLFALIFTTSCATTVDNDRVIKLEQKVAELEGMVLMGMTEGAAASFYPFSAGLIGGQASKLDKISSVSQGDTAIGLLEGHATYGDAFMPYVADNSADAESPPEVVDPDEAGDIRWKLAKIYESGFYGSPTSAPTVSFNDKDGLGADKDAGAIFHNMSTITDGAEVSDARWSFLDAGTERTFTLWDGSAWQLKLGVMTDDYIGGDVAGYESIMFDFDTATDAEVGISSPSGATVLNFGSLDLVTTGLVPSRMDGTPGTSGTYVGLIITGVNAGEAITAGDIVYMDGTSNEWMLADADAAGEFPALGMAAANRKVIQSGQVSFNQCTPVSWGTITHWAIFDAESAGNMLAHGQLATSKTINPGNTPSVGTTETEVEINAGYASNYLANIVLDFAFRNQAFSQPTIYVALCTSVIVDADTGITIVDILEDTTGAQGYARVAHSSWNAASGGALDNNGVITFGPPTGDWGNVTACAIVDSITVGAGNLLFYDNSLDDNPDDGDTVTFPSGDLNVSVS